MKLYLVKIIKEHLSSTSNRTHYQHIYCNQTLGEQKNTKLTKHSCDETDFRYSGLCKKAVDFIL